MDDVLVVGLFLIAFSGLMIVIYRVIGKDVKKVHGCHAEGIVVKQEEKTEDAL